MRFFLSLLLVCCILLPSYANEKFGAVLKEYAQRQKKPTFIFFDLRWCSLGSEKLPESINVIKQFSSCYNIVVCTTSENLKMFQNVRVDTFIDLKIFFPRHLSTKKEWKSMAQYYKASYGVSISKYIFTPSYMHIFDRNKFIDAFHPRLHAEEYSYYSCK